MAQNRDTTLFLSLVLLSTLVFIGELFFTEVPTARFQTVPAPGETRQPGPAGTVAAKHPLQYDAPTKNRDLFKNEKTAAEATLVDLATLETTGLKLKLWGTVTDESHRNAYAVIEDLETGQQGLYRPGASVQDAIVKIITREKVVLRVAGRDEVLEMAPRPAGEPDSLDPGFDDFRERRFALNRSLFEQAIRNISYTMNPAGLTRHIENDQHTGLLITTLWPDSIFRRLGLRNGDVLTLVAGEPVTSAKDVATLFEGLRSAANTEVQIKRQNRLQMLTYDLF